MKLKKRMRAGLRSFIAKLCHVFAPFLILAAGFMLLYTSLNWMLFIKLDIAPVQQEVLEFFLPFFLAVACAWMWLGPRLTLLRLSENSMFFYKFAAGVAIAIPTILAQISMHKAAGEMTCLNNVYEIAGQKNTRFYIFRDIYIDKQNAGTHVAFDTSGRINENLNMYLYLALPIWAGSGDMAQKSCPAWLGIEYSKQIHNSLSEAEKERLFQEFIQKSRLDFSTKELSGFAYLERAGHTAASRGLREALKTSPKYNGKNATILLPVGTPFEQRGRDEFVWSLILFAIGSTVWLVMLLPVRIHRSPRRALLDKARFKRESVWREVRVIMIPRRGLFFTPIIFYTNILVYMAMVFCGLGFLSFQAPDLIAWGANSRLLVMQGEWWRLLTSMFLHGGLVHVLVNMFTLVIAAIMLEFLIGSTRFIFSYMTCGIVASCMSIWWSADTVSVGASGAIFGIYGVLLAFALTKTFAAELGKSMLATLLIFLGLNLLLGFLMPGIDNFAHIGGLLTGFLIGLIISFSIRLRCSGRSNPDRGQ